MQSRLSLSSLSPSLELWGARISSVCHHSQFKYSLDNWDSLINTVPTVFLYVCITIPFLKLLSKPRFHKRIKLLRKWPYCKFPTMCEGGIMYAHKKLMSHYIWHRAKFSVWKHCVCVYSWVIWSIPSNFQIQGQDPQEKKKKQKNNWISDLNSPKILSSPNKTLEKLNSSKFLSLHSCAECHLSSPPSVFWDKVSLPSLGCPRTCCTDQAGFRLKRSTCLCFPRLGLKVYAHFKRPFRHYCVNVLKDIICSGHKLILFHTDFSCSIWEPASFWCRKISSFLVQSFGEFSMHNQEWLCYSALCRMELPDYARLEQTRTQVDG